MNLIDAFQQYIEENRLLTRDDRILLTVSGGVDSMVMLSLFTRCGYTVGVAHCNFQLRGSESDEDEVLVEEEARKYGAEIQFDEQAQTPYFTYQDEAGQPHEVWFEDARSALAKFGLLTEYGLSGLGYWNFMRPFAAGFSLQNYLFSIP